MKLEIVFFVLLIILTGMLLYLFYVDRKVRRLEDEIKNKKQL